jgi:hypothetical protein
MSYIGNPLITAAFVTDQFSGTGSQTVYTTSVAPAGTAAVLVSVSGVLQDPSTYSVSGTTLTFTGAPPTGTGNISCRYLGIPASGVTTTAYRTVTEFTATAIQTVFTPPSYTAGYIDVYRNGVRLGASDFTATNGTTVTLASGASAGDLVTTESYYVSSVIGAIPATSGAVNNTYLGTGAVQTANILDANVTQAKLAAGVAGNGPAFSVYQSTGQTLSQSVAAKIQFQTKEYDTNNNFDATTNYRFTPTVAGYYQVNAAICYNAGAGAQQDAIFIYKNGSAYKVGNYIADTGALGLRAVVSCLVYCNGSTDYIEIYGLYNAGPATQLTNSGSANIWFNGFLARAA